MVFNPRSLNNKAPSVMSLIEDKEIDLAAICETWLTDNSNPTTAAIKSYGYSLLHNFRTDRRGGGTAIIFKSIFSVNRAKLNVEQLKTFEFTAGVVKLSSSKKLLLLVVYRTGPLTSAFSDEIDMLLAEATVKFDNILLVGDLNVHFESEAGILVQQTTDVLLSYGLRRLVFQATHISGGQLDQIFATSLLGCDVLVGSGDCGISDHYPVYGHIRVKAERKYFKDVEYRKLKAISSTAFSHDIQCLVDNTDYSCDDFRSAVTNLNSESLSIIDSHAPLLQKTISVVDRAPWFDKEYRDKRKERRKAEKRKNLSSAHLIKYRDLCADTSQLAFEKKREHFTGLLNRAGSNTRTLYTVVNKEMDRKQSRMLPDAPNGIDKLATSFNDYFKEKIDKIRGSMPNNGCAINFVKDNQFNDSATNILSEFEPATIDELKVILNETGVKTSPADIFPQQLYKDNITALLPLLLHLVNLSISTGNMDGVKTADIIPLLKSESLDPDVLKNFRPVSNLTFLGKLIERVVLKRLNEHLSRNNLHCPEQFAYKKHHSTETLLVKITNDLLIAADERDATVVMLLDLSAAFDTVDHTLLLRILEKEIGLRGTVLAWFKSFLIGRSQKIRLGSATSDTIIIRFGVPQGSVLGPVLFNLYIRSIYHCVKLLGFTIMGYADDHQICKSFPHSKQCEVLSLELKNCFHGIKQWMSKYFLQLNDSKTQIIVFGPSKTLNKILIQGVNITLDTNIRFVSTVKNLGMEMDRCLTFRSHVMTLKQKCFHTLRNVRKLRFLLSQDQLKVLVNSLVVSCIDYCNGVLFGISEKLLHQLQLIQNAAAKAISGKYKYDSVGDDIEKLHWLTVKKRIIFKIGLLAYKSVNGQAPLYLQDMFKYAHHGHTVKLIVPQFNGKYGSRSFSVIGPRVLNNLPEYVISAFNITTFKSKLKTYLFTLNECELNKLYRT